jgi:protein-tyrosine phosphatase
MSASRVYPNLWVGGIPPQGKTIGQVADILVLCAEEHQPASSKFPGVKVVRCPIPDGKLSGHEVHLVGETGRMLADKLQHGGKVVCTCQMGLNRSSLVACVAMCLAGKLSPSTAISAVRMARGRDAMFNRHFHKYLNSIVLHHALGPGDCRGSGYADDFANMTAAYGPPPRI